MRVNELKKQLIGYVISGILATLTDFIIYSLLSRHHLLSYNKAKSISFLTGTIIAYVFNRYVTFLKLRQLKQQVETNHTKQNLYEITKFFVLYIFSMVCNVFTNSISLSLLNEHFDHALQINLKLAFLIATIVSVIINFLGQKFWVFR